MKKYKNLKHLSTEISNNLLDTIYLIEILEKILDASGKEEIVLKALKNRIKKSFYTVETCRKMISTTD